MIYDAVIILHGWGLSKEVFAPLTNELKRHAPRVYTPDLPGFGNAKIPERPLHLTDYVDFLYEYVQKHNIKHPLIIGHSFGGRVALKYLATYHDGAYALVLTGTPGFTPISRKKLMLFITIAKVGKLFFLIPFISLLRDHVRRWYYYVVGAKDFYRAEGVMRDTFKNVVREELVASMEKIRVPTLLLWGDKDIIIPVSIARHMKEVIHGATLIIVPNIGHALPYKNPKEFCATLLPWLETV